MTRPRARDLCRRLAAVVLAVGLAAPLGACSAGPTGQAVRDAAPAPGPVGLDATSPPPWPAPQDVAARVAAAGLDLGPMGTAEHYHPHLRVVVGNADVPVPGNIGVDPATGAMSALHTHEPDGTLHVEADTVGEVFTLGQLFTQWGVKLTATQIGGVEAGKGERVRLTSNGSPVTVDPRKLRLQPDQQIVLELS